MKGQRDAALTEDERLKIGDAIAVGMPNFLIGVADGGPLALTVEAIIRTRLATAKVEVIRDLRDRQDDIPGSTLLHEGRTIWLHTRIDVDAWLGGQEARVRSGQ